MPIIVFYIRQYTVHICKKIKQLLGILELIRHAMIREVSVFVVIGRTGFVLAPDRFATSADVQPGFV